MDIIGILLDAIDELDNGGEAVRIAKSITISSQGFAELGDRSPITQKEFTAWFMQYQEYRRLKLAGKDNTRLRGELIMAAFTLLQRCFTTKNSDTLLERIAKRWKC